MGRGGDVSLLSVLKASIRRGSVSRSADLVDLLSPRAELGDAVHDVYLLLLGPKVLVGVLLQPLLLEVNLLLLLLLELMGLVVQLLLLLIDLTDLGLLLRLKVLIGVPLSSDPLAGKGGILVVLAILLGRHVRGRHGGTDAPLQSLCLQP